MKKVLSVILIILTVASAAMSLLPASVAAAGETVYVNPSAAEGGGSYKTLDAAIAAVAGGGTVVLNADVRLTANFTEPAHTGVVTITSKSGSLIIATDGFYNLSGATVFKDIDISGSGKAQFVANFNPITFDTGVTKSVIKGGKSCNIYVIGGYYAPADAALPLDGDTNITIKSGTFYQICGFSSTRGEAGTLTFTGTSHIRVDGGTVISLYGASVANHISGNTEIIVNDGVITGIYTGGDLTRRLNGNAKIEINGGNVTAVQINNVVGNTSLRLAGGKIMNITSSYGNSTIEKLAANAKKTLEYNSLIFTETQLTKFLPLFDETTGFGTVYVKDGGTGDGYTREAPLGSLDAAFKLYEKSTGTISIVDKCTVAGDFTEPSHSGLVTLTGGTLAFGGDANYTQSGNTKFENITLEGAGKIALVENGYTLTVGEGCTVNAAGGASIIGGGENKAANIDIIVYSGKFDTVYACGGDGSYTGEISITAAGGQIEKITTRNGSATVNGITVGVLGAEVGSVAFDGVTSSYALSLMSGSLGACTAQNSEGSGTLTYNASIFSADSVASFVSLFKSVRGDRAVFVKDGGDGDGASSSSPYGTIAEAYAALAATGGHIVLCGPTTLFATFVGDKHSEPITITSSFGGVDYAATAGARLNFGGSYYIYGPTNFDHIEFFSSAESKAFYCNGNTVSFGAGIVCTKAANVVNYLSIYAGAEVGTDIKSTDLTIMSGTYSYVLGGNYAVADADITDGKTKVTINGGTFNNPVCAASNGYQTGTAELTINGGAFLRGIYGTTDKTASMFNGELNITINSARIVGEISAAGCNTASLFGSFNLTLNGGDYASVADIKGSSLFSGKMVSNITTGDNVDVMANEAGNLTFKNPIRVAADPWIIYHDGYYYYTSTAGSSIGIAKVTNISDLTSVTVKPVFTPAADKPFSKNLWSPELHYFSEEDFGAEVAGWYLFIACDDGDNNNHRMYVMKASDKNDPMSTYCNPVSGELNVPLLLSGKDDDIVNKGWSAGQTILRCNGKVYTMWVGENYEGTRRYQIIYIGLLENPWTVVGNAGIICLPTESWEKKGAGLDANGKNYPEVVEGGTAVYGPNGEIYVIYSGSGYWTTYYELGQLKLVGDDPLVYENWEKTKDPIFSKSAEINGCGHASYTVSPDGTRNWICYHAYTGADTKSGRFAFFEEYSFKDGNVVVGNGSTHPADINTEYSIKVNPMPLVRKISGFANFGEFLTVPNMTIASGKSVNTSKITVYGGASYDSETYGEIAYSYRAQKTIGAWTEGLPTENGVYDVMAKIVDNDLYAGLSGSFVLTVGGVSSDMILIIVVIAVAVLAIGGTVVFVVKSGKKK